MSESERVDNEKVEVIQPGKSGRPRGTKIPVTVVAEELRKLNGGVYLVAFKLGIAPATIYRYIARYPSVAQAKADADGEMLDIAENKLRAALKAGEPWAIKFVLMTKGKDRGYTERKEVTGADGAPLQGSESVISVVVHDNEGGA